MLVKTPGSPACAMTRSSRPSSTGSVGVNGISLTGANSRSAFILLPFLGGRHACGCQRMAHIVEYQGNERPESLPHHCLTLKFLTIPCAEAASGCEVGGPP